MSIGVFGLGYVGGTVLRCFSAQYKVYGIDTDKNKVKQMKQVCPKARVTSDAHKVLSDIDYCFICVNTPSTKTGDVDLTNVEAVFKTIARHLRNRNKYILIILKSTVPSGTTYKMIKILEKYSGKKCGKNFGVCMNPEFLREATPINDFMLPSFVIIGSHDLRSYMLLRKLYRSVGIGKQYQLDIKSAELFKYVNNTFHALKVSFANEVYRISDKLGIDAVRLMEIFCKDKKLNISDYYLKPANAFEGSCLPKDVRGLIQFIKTNKIDCPVIESVIKSNDKHKKFMEKKK